MHYLDYAATTPVPRAVAEAMAEALTESFGNPSSQYSLGRQARDRLERDRRVIAGALGCKPEQLFFTSCGTEGDNWAIRAALHQNRRVGRHIVTTAVEHSAVLQCLKALEREGYSVTYLKPDGQGRIAASQVAEALREDTALVSVMLVNNETGARFPVEEIAALLHDRPALLHTDAVQAFLKVPSPPPPWGRTTLPSPPTRSAVPRASAPCSPAGGPRSPSPSSTAEARRRVPAPAPRPPPRSPASPGGPAPAGAAGGDRRPHRDLNGYARERLAAIPDLRFIGAGDAPHILSVTLDRVLARTSSPTWTPRRSLFPQAPPATGAGPAMSSPPWVWTSGPPPALSGSASAPRPPGRMWTPWRRRWRSTGGSGFPCCERGFHPRTPFSLRLCRRKAPMGLDSPVAGRAGKKHVSFRNLAGAPPPDPGLLFSCQKSNQKDIQGGGCFDSPSPLKIPHPQRHKGGRLSPFGIPRRTFQYPVRRWILPQVRRKNYVSPSTNRNIFPFHRASAEASLTARL